jgi:Chaperone of endosialidase
MKKFALALLIVCTVAGLSGNASAKESRIADFVVSSGGAIWQPLQPQPGLLLTVSVPGGENIEQVFAAGATPSLTLAGSEVLWPDGHYGWELRVVVADQTVVRDDEYADGAVADGALEPALTQSGGFTVSQGVIADPSIAEEGALKDIQHLDDVIIAFSLAVGNDAVNGESFGFDTIRLKENNLRIHFDDTSTTASFPKNDWRLVANDTSNGGGEYFAIEDSTAGRKPFRVDAGARANALYVDSQGDVGIGTSSPVVELHAVRGDTPTLRLDQDGTSGFTPQVWDVAGNETNFFIRDVTNGSRLPFKIRPGAPTDALVIAPDGNVGIGTSSPSWPLTVKTNNENAIMVLNRNDTSTLASMSAGGTFVNMGSSSDHGVNLIVNNDPKVTVDTDGDVGIGTTTPGFPLELVTTGEPATFVFDRTDGAAGYVTAGGTYVNMGSSSNNHLRLMVNGAWKTQINTDGALTMASGATCTVGGVWVNSSSRELKDNIEGLTTGEAMKTLAGLEPVKYNYKVDQADAHVGFIAEDVPNLVATKDRKGLSPMDVTAVLTKVVQEQQRVIAELQSRLDALEHEAHH